jgi:glycosyltransferase involved in cell wall biosynthesis
VLPLVSIIVPIYNMEKYLRKCIDSAIGQSYNEIEIILVDDGSSDKSGEICDEYSGRNSNIKVIHKHNQGLVSARKDGLTISSGDFIVPLDADDWIEPYMIEEMMDKMTAEKIDMAQCGLVWEYADGKKFINDDIIAEGMYDLALDYNRIYRNLFTLEDDQSRNGMRLNICSCIFKREVLIASQKHVPDKLCNGEDDALFFVTMLQSQRFYKFEHPYYHSLVRNESMSRSAKMFNPNQVFMIENTVRPILDKHKQKSNIEFLFNRYLLNMLNLYAGVIWGCSYKKMYNIDISTIPLRSKIVLYGAGEVGQSLYYIFKNKYSIVAWLDERKRSAVGVKIERVNVILNLEFDYVILASAKSDVLDDMDRMLLGLGVSKNKIVKKRAEVINENACCVVDSV